MADRATIRPKGVATTAERRPRAGRQGAVWVVGRDRCGELVQRSSALIAVDTPSGRLALQHQQAAAGGLALAVPSPSRARAQLSQELVKAYALTGHVLGGGPGHG